MQIHKKTSITAAMLTLCCMAGYAQQQVKGVVTDAQGEPIIGVTVVVDGKPTTTTDADGQFTLTSATPKSKVQITYIGYEPQTVTVGNQSTLNIVLRDDQQLLNEVVVVGYGVMKKNDLTGAVASIGNDKLNEKGAPSILQNLQGSVPGVNITQSTGRTGASMDIEIRGKNSLNLSQKPIYVVDGVVCSDIDFLNPQDIDRIDVLKDASSTAIYGSRATAGVVMVTTKSGANIGQKTHKPTINYDGYYGVSKVARMPDFQNASEFYQYRFMKFLTMAGGDTNNGQPIWVNTDIDRCLLLRNQADPNSGYVMKELLASGKTYDWPDLVLQDGRQQNHYVSINGGNVDTHYHMGVGYLQEEGQYKGDEQSKFTVKGSLDAKVSKYVSTGFSVNLARQDHDYASTDAVRYAFRSNPFMQPYNADGSVTFKPGHRDVLGTDMYQFTDAISPLVFMDDETSNRLSWTALANLYLEVRPLEGLSLKTTFMPTFSYQRYGFYQSTDVNGADVKEAQRTTSQVFSWTWDNMVTYDRTFAKDHHVNLMGLVSSTFNNSESDGLYYTGVREGTYWWNLRGGEYDNTKSGADYSEWRMLSYALRANYSFKGRYMLTGTVRWDGSSRFADGNRWGSFPSVAAAWRVSEESFMDDAGDWLSNLKLRASYGTTGNNNVGNFATRLVVSNPVYYPFGSTYSQGTLPSGIVDRDLQWEIAHELNIGLDFGFLNDRVRGTVDWYNKKSDDLLYDVKLPLEAGGNSVTTNIGSVRNRGVEISLTTANVQTRDWLWSTTFTFARNKNKVLEINGTGNVLTGSDTGNLFIGEMINNVYGYEWDGIVSDREMTVPDNDIARLKGFTPGDQVKEAAYYNACYGLVEGNPIIVDRNGDGTFDDSDKKIYHGDPKWTGSISSNLSWRDWDFSFSIYFKQNYTVKSNFYGEYLNLADRGRMRLDVDWYIPAGTLIDCDGINPDGTYINPKYQEQTHYGSYPFPNYGANYDGLGSNYWLGSTNTYTDASFVKVKHITLGYTVPQKWISKAGCSHLRLYTTVTNPFVFTDYKGYDPEWANASLQDDGPSTVTVQFGASVKF